LLDQGQKNDWFGSNVVLAFVLISAVCLIALIPWELIREHPIIDLRLLGRRQFGTCWPAMLGAGAVLISTTQMLPQILQSEFNYTALLAGLELSPGGLATLIMMPIVGRLVGFVQPKYLIMVGGSIVTLAMWYLTGLNGDISYGYAAFSRVILGLGLPLLFLPFTTASYDGIPPDKTNQVAALINVACNVGGSMGVALAQTTFAQRQQFHHSRLVEHISPPDLGCQQTIDALTRYFQDQGAIGKILQTQVDLLSCIDVFWTLGIIAAILVPLGFILRPIDLGAAPKGH